MVARVRFLYPALLGAVVGQSGCPLGLNPSPKGSQVRILSTAFFFR